MRRLGHKSYPQLENIWQIRARTGTVGLYDNDMILKLGLLPSHLYIPVGPVPRITASVL
jgi:hypothetical protein